MYRNVVLTLLTVTAIYIAVRLSHPKPALLPVDDEQIFQANRQVLEKRFAVLALRNTTVGGAIEQLCRGADVPLAANWKDLEGLRDHPVDIELRNVSLGDAMQFLLALDGLYRYRSLPDFSVANGTLVIAAHARQPYAFPVRSMTVRVYEVGDLLTDEFWGCKLSGTIPADGDSRIQALQDLLQEDGGLVNWPRATGSLSMATQDDFASITSFGTKLVVLQTTYGHMRIESFLAQLRVKGNAVK
jgi:hypothetical protein